MFRASYAVFVLPVFIAMPLAAQEVSTHEPAESTEGLSVIVVTAQKRSQDLQDVGISVTALPADELAKRGVESLADVAQIATNVDVYDIYGNGSLPVWEIRGVGLQDYNSNNTPAAALYIDEVYQSSSAHGAKSIFDLQQIEILKGPQGGLYGRNTASGAVLITTRKPELGAFSGDLGVSIGRWARVEIEGGVNIPLGENAALRFSTQYVRSDNKSQRSVITGQGYGEEDASAFRAQLLIEPSDAVSILTKVQYSDNRSETTLGRAIPVFAGPGGSGLGGTADPGNPTSGMFCSTFAATGIADPNECYFANGVLGSSVLTDDVDDVYGDLFGGLDNKAIDADLRVEIDLGGMLLTSISAYSDFDYGLKYDFAGIPGDRLKYDAANNIEQYSQEIRLASDNGARLSWMIGGSYSRENYTENRDILLGDSLGVLFELPNLVLPVAYDQVTTSWAGYGQIEYEISDTWRAIGSIRYTDENKTFFNRSSTFFTSAQQGQVPDYNLGIWSGKASLEWKPTDGALLYLSASKGFKAGGFFGGLPTFDGAISQYGHETNFSYELGWKTDWFDGRMRVNGAVFYYDYRDGQGIAGAGDSLGGVVSNLSLINIGDYEYKGAELTVDLEPIDGLLLSGAFGYVDARVDSSDLIGQDRLTGAFFDYEGQKVQGVADWTYNLFARYEARLTDALNWSVQGEYSYKAPNLQIASDQTVQSLNFWTVDAAKNLSGRVGVSGDNWSIALAVKNILDQRNVVQRNFDAVDGYLAIYSQPRTWSIDLSYEF